MEIEYKNTPEDVIAFNLYHQQNSPILRRRFLIFRFIFPIVLVLLSVSPVGLGYPSWGTTLVGVMMAVAWIFIYPFIFRTIIKIDVTGMLKSGKNKALFGAHRICISPDEITVSGESEKTGCRWSAIEQIVTTDRYLYIYNSAMTAFCIPKSAFAGDAQYNEFVETARSYLRKSTGT